MEIRPIYNDEVEKVIFEACLRDREEEGKNVPIILDRVQVDDLYSEKRKAYLKAIISLNEKKAPIDSITLSCELKIQGYEITSTEILEDLSDHYFLGLDIDYYIDQLKICSKRRKLQTSLYNAIRKVQDTSTEYAKLEENITQELMAILDGGKDDRIKTGRNLLGDILENYYKRKTCKEVRETFGVPTGFKALDSILGGLQDGTLGILAGRQHHGKSTAAMDMFLYALKNGISSLYISLEQPSPEILLHLIQKETGIKPLNIKSGNLTENEERILTGEIYSEFKKLPVFFEDQTRTLGEISMKIRRMVLSHQVKFVVADYLQLIENPIKGEPRHIEVAGISRALKRLAMDLNIPILALSQLNKNPEERESKKIYLSDMRESEAISQDTDYVIFIHRPVLMGKDDKDHLELAKNRHGEAIPRVNVNWDRRRNTYRELGDTNERQGSL